MIARHYTAFDPNDILLKADILIKAKMPFRVSFVDTYEFHGWLIEWEEKDVYDHLMDEESGQNEVEDLTRKED